MTLRVISYGGGVQSTAMLVLAAQGVIDFTIALFANVGDDSEHPATLRYVREVAMPYAQANGIALEELHRRKRDGSTETLYGRLTQGSVRSIGIPARMGGSGAPGRRQCTTDFKIKLIGRWLVRRGATARDPATLGLGISLDEFQRAQTPQDARNPYQVREYPLIALRLARQDCITVIARAGMPVPPKSSCWFCPFHRLSAWQRQRDDEPELFGKSVALEAMLSQRHEALGRGPLFFTDKHIPLDRATSPHRQLPMLGMEADDACESGYCMV